MVLLLLLSGCGGDKVKNQQSTSETDETTYIEGFPKEDSPALSKFIQNNISMDQELLNDHGTLIFSDRNLNEEATSITYYQYTEGQLKENYERLFQAEDVSRSLYEMRQSDNLVKLRSPLENNEQYSLPTVNMKENNQLDIKTTKNQRTINLNEAMKDYGITNATKFIMNIEAVNENHIVLVLEDIAKLGQLNELYYLFIDQALSNFTIVQLKYKETQKVIDSQVLKPYYDIFPGVESYKSLFDRISILDETTNTITEIKEHDLLSEDGQFVYLNSYVGEIPGENLSDGVQRIQTIENYAKGNDIYEAQFTLDYDAISKQLNFETNKIGIARITYFNKDYVVLSLLYKGKVIGDGGSTNVIVDLQDKKKPIAYLVDLGIE